MVEQLAARNPAAYRLYTPGPNGIFEDGGGDDVGVPISSVSYDTSALTATLQIAAGSAPLADNSYRLPRSTTRTRNPSLSTWSTTRACSRGGVRSTRRRSAISRLGTSSAHLTMIGPDKGDGSLQATRARAELPPPEGPPKDRLARGWCTGQSALQFPRSEFPPDRSTA